MVFARKYSGQHAIIYCYCCCMCDVIISVVTFVESLWRWGLPVGGTLASNTYPIIKSAKIEREHFGKGTATAPNLARVFASHNATSHACVLPCCNTADLLLPFFLPPDPPASRIA